MAQLLRVDHSVAALEKRLSCRENVPQVKSKLFRIVLRNAVLRVLQVAASFEGVSHPPPGKTSMISQLAQVALRHCSSRQYPSRREHSQTMVARPCASIVLE